MMANQELLTIQEVAAATGLSTHTLRYYERIGLIHSIDRAGSGHRRYSPDNLGWIDFLLKLRSTGMSVQEMQKYTQLQRAGDNTLPERLEMLKTLRNKVEVHIDELEKNLGVVRYKIEIYQQEVDERKKSKKAKAKA
jgi:DNA-binding transcriptional MerR regulator